MTVKIEALVEEIPQTFQYGNVFAREDVGGHPPETPRNCDFLGKFGSQSWTQTRRHFGIRESDAAS